MVESDGNGPPIFLCRAVEISGQLIGLRGIEMLLRGVGFGRRASGDRRSAVGGGLRFFGWPLRGKSGHRDGQCSGKAYSAADSERHYFGAASVYTDFGNSSRFSLSFMALCNSWYISVCAFAWSVIPRRA